jgi:hypothetical protein
MSEPLLWKEWSEIRRLLTEVALGMGLDADKVEPFIEDAKKSFRRLHNEMVAADPSRFTVGDNQSSPDAEVQP